MTTLPGPASRGGAPPPAPPLRRLHDFDQWHELVVNTTIPLLATVESGVTFHGTLYSRTVGDVDIVRTASVAQRVSRTARACRESSKPMVMVLVQRSGRALIGQEHRRAQVDGGFLTLYDTNIPYTLAQTTDFSADAILIPRDRLPVPARHLEDSQEEPISLEHGPGEMFISYLDSFLRQVDVCSPTVATRCSSVLLELLWASLLEAAPAAPRSGDTMRETAVMWIDRHLGDADLTPAKVAGGTGMSIRYLHRLFEGSGTTVAGYIRSKRLQRIRADLMDPRLATLTIARVGAQWGVSDPAHLSRLFRSEFGLTPRDVRQQAHGADGEALNASR